MDAQSYYTSMAMNMPNRTADLAELVTQRGGFCRLALSQIERPDGSRSWGVAVAVDEGYDEETARGMLDYFACQAAAARAARTNTPTLTIRYSHVHHRTS
jgi:hypothetical protein